jgi:glycosyltransferase involved in cell wall biosynthesis
MGNGRMKKPSIPEVIGKAGWPWTAPSSSGPATLPAQEWPRVSLVMPCFNGAQFLEESIRSILLQDYPNLELLVMDAGSQDGTVELIRKYEPWIAYWESKPDRGQSHAINKGLAKATGVYFNWHNADDLLAPGALMESVKGFVQHPDAVFIARHRVYLDEKGQMTQKATKRHVGAVEMRKAFVSLCPGIQPGGLMRKDLVIAAGGVDEELHCAMDEDLMLRLLLDGPGYYIEGIGCLFRRHAGQKTQRLTTTRIQDKFRVREKIYRRLRKDSPWRELWAESGVFCHRWAAGLCASEGRRLAGWLHRLRAALYLQFKPTCPF